MEYEDEREYWDVGYFRREDGRFYSDYMPSLSVSENTTYEEMNHWLTEFNPFTIGSSPPSHYQIDIEAYKDVSIPPGKHSRIYGHLSGSASLREGQTMASTQLISTTTGYLKFMFSILRNVPLPPKKKTSSTSPSSVETISTVASMGLVILTVTASVATIIQTLIVVQERWEKTHQASSTGSPQRLAQPKQTDIYAVRLRMTDGREHTLQNWLTEPDELKHFIDVFLQPSSNVKPTEVVFVLWNRETIVVDVTKGAQGNLQLDEVLKYLKIDSAEK